MGPGTPLSFESGHGAKVGPSPGTQDLAILGPGTLGPETQDPPQSLKVGPETPLTLKSGNPGPPSKFKIGTPTHLSLMNSFFSEYFIVFLLIYFCVFFK